MTFRSGFDRRADAFETLDRRDDGFTTVIGAGLAFWSVCAVAVLIAANTGQQWVPIIDSANLAFHEFGHPFFGLFSDRLAVYGGTLAQLAFPVATTVHFLRRRETLSTAFCALWLAQNLMNVARYMADARAMELPLVGGLDPEDSHDWRLILMRWGLLQWDTTLAAGLRFAAVASVVGLGVWLARRWRDDRAARVF